MRHVIGSPFAAHMRACGWFDYTTDSSSKGLQFASHFWPWRFTEMLGKLFITFSAASTWPTMMNTCCNEHLGILPQSASIGLV